MASINYATREISCKIVYYGPGLSGKTTNLQIIHRKIPDKDKSEMVSLATETDRTLFFDFLPLDLGSIKGFSTKFQLYTVPGQVYYNATRKLVLRGVDGVVFVVDSQMDKLQENLESFANLQENLREYGHSIENIPLVLQYNKRDLPNIYQVEQLNALINKLKLPHYEAVAATGVGVFTTLKGIGKSVIDKFNAKYAGFQGTRRPIRPGESTTTAPASQPKPQPAAPPPPPPPPRPTLNTPQPFPGNFGGNKVGFGNPMTPPVPPAPPNFPPQFNANPPPKPAPISGPAPSGGFVNPFASNNPGPMSFGGPEPKPLNPPLQANPLNPVTPPNSPNPFSPPSGGIPISPFVEGFATPKPTFPGPSAGGPNLVPPPANPFGAPPPSQPFGQNRPSAPIGGPIGGGLGGVSGNGPMGGGPLSGPLGGNAGPFSPPSPPSPPPGMGNAPPPFPPRNLSQGPFPTLSMPLPNGAGTFGEVKPPPPNPAPPSNPPSNPPVSGNSSGFVDKSGIVTTYEDMAKDDSFKTKKLPHPNEKKKGFFDGLFKKDK